MGYINVKETRTTYKILIKNSLWELTLTTFRTKDDFGEGDFD
jgi:hypothetical protein